MVTFYSEKISPRITRIRDGSDVCEYLIEGNERAALIDTGYGIGDLKGYVESLTDKPYDVFVTHGHVDHAAGAAQFEKVYMHPADQALFEVHCEVAFRKEMVESHTGLKLEDADYLPKREAPFTDLEDGMEVDLGGLTVTFLHIPGHTQGMMVPLVKEERTVFFGDACGVGVLLMLPEAGTVAEYLESLKKLKKYEPYYDVVLRQHGTCTSTPHVLEDNIENCENILNGTDAHIEHDMMGVTCYWACEIDPATGGRKDGREGNIRYSLDHVR